jgi:spermidine synthase
MKPRLQLAETLTPDGGRLVLCAQDGAFSINFAGQELMHSRAQASEVLLGQLGVEHLIPGTAAKVLVGGLGLGMTLQSVITATSEFVVIEVVELIPAVIAWNRSILAELNCHALAASNVVVLEEDAINRIKSSSEKTYDAIILDLDNGPIAMVAQSNHRLYGTKGLRSVYSALKDGGRAVFWSAKPDDSFQSRLEKLNFTVTAVPAKVHESAKRAAYTLYVAERKG